MGACLFICYISSVDCSVIYVMDEDNKCSSLGRSDCTLETLLSENNHCPMSCQSSSSITTAENDLVSSTNAL